MAEETLQRRKSMRNRGEPPVKLRKTSPVQEVSTLSTPTIRKSVPKSTPNKQIRGRSVKSTPKTRARGSSKPSPSPEPAEEEQLEAIEPLARESMVMLMEQSRQRWITEGGIFEKFWTKPPRKKKGQPAVDMPSRSQMNMVEIGPVRVIIEPHVFDIQLHGVKKPSLSWQQPTVATQSPAPANPYSSQSTPQRPMQNPYPKPGAAVQQQSQSTPVAPGTPVNARGMAPNPYAVSNSNSSTPTAKLGTTASQVPAVSASTAPVSPSTLPVDGQQGTKSAAVKPTTLPADSHAVAIARVSDKGPAPSPKAAASASNSPAPPHSSSKAPAASASAKTLPPIQVSAPRAQTARPPPPQPPQQPQQQSAPHPDPVIQMLAQRAASDPALKELMKIVAAGSTSPEKLKEFQKHIDDINAIVTRQKQEREQQQKQPKQQQKAQSQAQRQQSQQYRAQPFIASKPQPAPQPSRYDFGNIVFDFVRGSDCYLLPRRSIVQHLPDGMTTLISFIVTRKGKDVPNSTSLKAEVEYYQPMTMTLLTMEQKIRDAINQVIMTKEQVTKEMKDIMERCTPAPIRGLMSETPECSDAMDLDDNSEQGTTKGDVDILKSDWDPPDALVPFSGK